MIEESEEIIGIPNITRIFSISIIIIFLIIFYSFKSNLTNIPELDLYNNQTLKLLLPSKKCKFQNKKTLYFTSNFRNNSNELNNKYEIIDFKNKKNSFVTYYLGDEEYEQYEELFSEHNLIKSENFFGDNNLFLSKGIINLMKKNKSILQNNEFKKYYRFFGYQVLMKDSLYFNYLEMKQYFNDEFNFMPETYYYPDDKYIIFQKFSNYSLNLDDLWFVKPANKWGGRGISILKSLDKIELDNFLINKYITNLDLINGKKYDLRLYVLVTGLKPLRIYLNKEGLIRIASKVFSLKKKTINNKYIHLTNTGINSQNKNFIFPNSNNINNENANIWNLNTYEKHLNKINVDYNQIMNKIKDIIIKSITSVYKNLTSELSNYNLNDINFYDILGYDIIITNKYDPILLEINTGPSTYMYNELDKPIKTNLIVDTLNIVGISPFNKNIIINKNKKLKIDTKYNVKNAFCELTRPKGDFELIFPLKDNINLYKKFFKDRNNEENELFWKEIEKSE